MGDAYAYADSATPVEPPIEITTLRYIDRFGVNAVMGRSFLWAGEMRMMTLAEAVINAFRQRAESLSITEWSNTNPEKAELLALASEIAEEGNYLNAE